MFAGNKKKADDSEARDKLNQDLGELKINGKYRCPLYSHYIPCNVIGNSSTICDTILVNESMSRYSKQQCRVKGDIVYFCHLMFQILRPSTQTT